MNAPSWPVNPTALPPCDFLVRLAEHHLDDVHHAIVGHAHPLAELALDAHLGQQVADLRAAAVDDDRVHADKLQHDDVAREARLQRCFGHRVAAVLDDDRPVVKAADVRQSLGQYFRLDGGVDSIDRHGGRQWNCVRAKMRGNCTRTSDVGLQRPSAHE